MSNSYTIDEQTFLKRILDMAGEQLLKWDGKDLHRWLEVYISLRSKILRESHDELKLLRSPYLDKIDEWNKADQSCPTCKGKRFIEKAHGMAMEQVKCPTCSGN